MYSAYDEARLERLARELGDLIRGERLNSLFVSEIFGIRDGNNIARNIGDRICRRLNTPLVGQQQRNPQFWRFYSFRHYICFYDSLCGFFHLEQTCLSCGLPSNTDREAQYIQVSHRGTPTIHIVHNHSPSSKAQKVLKDSQKKTIATNLVCEVGGRIAGITKDQAAKQLREGTSRLLNESAHILVLGGDFNCDESHWITFFKEEAVFEHLQKYVRICESHAQALHGDTAVVFNADVMKTESRYGKSFGGFSDSHDAVPVWVILTHDALVEPHAVLSDTASCSAVVEPLPSHSPNNSKDVWKHDLTSPPWSCIAKPPYLSTSSTLQSKDVGIAGQHASQNMHELPACSSDDAPRINNHNDDDDDEMIGSNPNVIANVTDFVVGHLVQDDDAQKAEARTDTQQTIIRGTVISQLDAPRSSMGALLQKMAHRQKVTDAKSFDTCAANSQDHLETVPNQDKCPIKAGTVRTNSKLFEVLPCLKQNEERQIVQKATFPHQNVQETVNDDAAQYGEHVDEQDPTFSTSVVASSSTSPLTEHMNPGLIVDKKCWHFGGTSTEKQDRDSRQVEQHANDQGAIMDDSFVLVRQDVSAEEDAARHEQKEHAGYWWDCNPLLSIDDKRVSGDEQSEDTDEESEDENSSNATEVMWTNRTDDEIWQAFLAAAACISTEASNQQREIAQSIKDLTDRFLHPPEHPKGCMWIHSEQQWVELCAPPALVPAQKFQHLLAVTRQRYQNAISHRCWTARGSPALTEDEREQEMERWRNDIHEWSKKADELRRASPQKRRSAFETYKFQLCGNKDLVHMLVQFPLHMAVNPVMWIRSFLRSQDYIRQLPAYDQAVRQSIQLTQEQKVLKNNARRQRRQYQRAQQIVKLLQNNRKAWYRLTDDDQQLWWRIEDLKNAMDEANAKTGHSQLSHSQRVPMRSWVARQMGHDGVTPGTHVLKGTMRW